MKRAIRLLAYGFAAFATPASADDWHSEANYPARIIAFSFGSATLDQNHTVNFGSWTVSFNQEGPPIYQAVHYYLTGGTQYSSASRGDSAYGLVCTNAIQGSMNCSLYLQPPSDRDPRDYCGLRIGASTTFLIACPDSVTFQH